MTSPYGRAAEFQGYPINVCELLATLDGAVYVERTAANNVRNIMATKRAIKKAFLVQKAKLGFSIVEILSTCPTNWGLNPLESMKWLEENMMPRYPLGVFKGKDLEVG
jgi:2-oxoglutarate ferredoxin oxidoreductase subunit beta